MNKIKLIALDLDGTALTPQNKVAETTTDAVRRAREAGVYVAVSTGRICGEARDFAVDLDADDLMVTSGGATLSSISGEGCTMRMSMPWEAAVRAAAAVERIGMIAMIYVGETLLITPYDDLGFGSYKTNEGYLTSKKVVPSVAEYIADHHLSVDKIFVRSQDSVTLLRTRAILEQIPGIRVMSSAADNLEVITPAADKGTACCAATSAPISTTPPPSETAKTISKCCARLRSPSPWATHRARSRRCAAGRPTRTPRTASRTRSTASSRTIKRVTNRLKTVEFDTYL